MIVALCPNSYDPLYNAVPLYNEHFLREIFRPKNRVIEGDYCTRELIACEAKKGISFIFLFYSVNYGNYWTLWFLLALLFIERWIIGKC